MRVLLRVLLLLLPLCLYGVWVDSWRGDFACAKSASEVWPLIGKALLGFIPVGIWMFVLLRRSLLPLLGQQFAERLYGGAYLPDEDPLVLAVRAVRSSKDEAQLLHLESVVRADATRLRGWQELARVRQEVFGAPDRACDVLCEGAEAVTDPQDKALLLYRAGCLAERALGNRLRARRCFERAAECYPHTVYGRLAEDKLK